MDMLFYTFLIAVLGYFIGSVSIMGLKLGTSAVLLVALVFGHYDVELPTFVRDIGLVCFVAAVGFIAGPVFFDNFRSQAVTYLILGVVIILCGALFCAVNILVCGTPVALSVGIMTGALTSTPGLAAAIEATGSDLASIGYGIAYPFGVVGVVLFVQLAPRIYRKDIATEGLLMERDLKLATQGLTRNFAHVTDDFGLFPFSLAITLGLLLAKLQIPLPGGARFSIGSAGGPMLVGLLFGHYNGIGRLSLHVPAGTLKVMREFGLVMFLIGAGTKAGGGFIDVLRSYGFVLFVQGVLITLIPMIVGFYMAHRLMKLDMLKTLGAICGGMTCTPALGTLISLAGTDAVAASYAATYPIALIMVILASQFISILM